MTNIPLGAGDWELPSEDITRIKVRNMYLIDSPVSPDNISRITRPSLVPFLDIDTDPVKAFWRQAGSIEGRWLIVIGETLYARDVLGSITTIGSLPGSGYCDFAADKDRVLIARDGLAYLTDGVTIDPLAVPDDQPVLSVACINGYFILTIEDSDLFYWMDPLEITIDPFDFATAERTPDPVTAVRIIFDEIWFPGIAGPEVWQATGDGEAPFIRINGRVYSEGCIGYETVATVLKDSLPALIWVTPQRSVVLAQGQVGRISNMSVEELLEEATNLRAWSFRTKKSDIYVLTTDQLTLVFDIQRKQWYRWDSYDLEYWRAHLGIQDGVNIYAGDAITGQIWQLGDDGFDDEDTPIVKEVTGLLLNPGDPVPCFVVNAAVNSGSAIPYVEPEPLELYISDDLGKTWSIAIQCSMGAAGEYATDVEYRSLGLMQRPGRMFRFRHTDKTKLRIDYATMNQGLQVDGD